MSGLDFYDRQAAAYVEKTVSLESVQPLRSRFLSELKASGEPQPWFILDAGSGSGRDTLAFLQAGCRVDAFDGSSEMAEHSSRLTGLTTQVMAFEELDLPAAAYDGIWAMASLLHVPRQRLPMVFKDLLTALKPGGVMVATFKYGHRQRYDRDGRNFTDMDESGLARLQELLSGFEVVETFKTDGPDTATGRTAWFEVVLRRTPETPQLSSAHADQVAVWHRYSQGDCDQMALALAQATGLPLGLWVTRGSDPMDSEETWDEPVHAVVVLDFDRPVWVDVDGVHEGVPPHLSSLRDGDWAWALLPSAATEVEEVFTMLEITSEDLQTALDSAKVLGVLKDVAEELKPALPPRLSSGPRPRLR